MPHTLSVLTLDHECRTSHRPRHTEVRRPPRRHNLAIGDALEQDRLVARSGGVAERADRLGGLVRVGGQQVVEAFVAERVQEPFAGSLSAPFCCLPTARERLAGKKGRQKAKDVHVRPGQPLQRVEAEAGVFDEDGALNLKDSLALRKS